MTLFTWLLVGYLLLGVIVNLLTVVVHEGEGPSDRAGRVLAAVTQVALICGIVAGW